MALPNISANQIAIDPANGALYYINEFNEIVTTSLEVFKTNDGITFKDNLIVTGDLLISGNTTTVNTETLVVEDNIIIINKGHGLDAATPNNVSGIEIDRGSSPSVSILWNETTDKWTFTNDGTNYSNIALNSITSSDTGTVTSTMILDGTILNEDINASAAIAQSKVASLTSDLALKASIASPTFTGTVAGITKTMVGLGSVDDTSDVGKPVSTAGQTALNLKANIASPTFTGTVAGITKAMVGLSSVDDTTDANKQVSTAGQTALDLKANLASPTLTGVPVAPTAVVGTNTTQLATTAFVTAASGGSSFAVTNSGSGSYVIDGVASATLTLIRGAKYFFNISASGHPFWIQTTSPGYNSASVYSTGVTNAGTDSGQVIFQVPLDAPNTLYYQCQVHSAMTGTLTIAGVTNLTGPITSVGAATSISSQTGTGTTFVMSVSPTFTGTIVLPAATSIGAVSSTEIGYMDGVTSAIQTQLDAKLASSTASSTYALIASPTFTGIVTTPSLIVDGIEIDTTGALNTQVLKYDSGTNKFIPGVASTVASLNDLTDVIITGTPTAGQVISYNGSDWINNSTSANTLDGLSDVTLTSPANGSIIIYDQSSSQWIDSAVRNYQF